MLRRGVQSAGAADHLDLGEGRCTPEVAVVKLDVACAVRMLSHDPARVGKATRLRPRIHTRVCGVRRRRSVGKVQELVAAHAADKSGIAVVDVFDDVHT